MIHSKRENENGEKKGLAILVQVPMNLSYE
jgi:hypothetical protein